MKRLLRTFGRYLSKNTVASLVVSPIVTFLVYGGAKAIELYLPEAYGNDRFHISHWASKVVEFFDAYPFHLFLVPITVMMIYSIITCLFWGDSQQVSGEINEKDVLVESFGALMFSERAGQEQQKSDWQFFLQLIKEENPSTIRILGASGCETFSQEHSPLHDLVKSFSGGSMQILMLDSDSPCILDRAKSINVKVSDYRSETKRSLSYLKKLRETKESLSVKLYSHLPNWKMVLTDKYLWLQYYSSENHVEDTVVYMVYKNNDNQSLYTPFLYEFNRLWEAAQDA